MNGHKLLNSRRLSIAGFSFLFAYILSFQFEGQVLYSLLDMRGTDADCYILAAIIAHFAGLFTCGLFVKFLGTAKYGTHWHEFMLDCYRTSSFVPSSLWLGGLIISGYFSGCAVAAWGFFSGPLPPRTRLLSPAQMF